MNQATKVNPPTVPAAPGPQSLALLLCVDLDLKGAPLLRLQQNLADVGTQAIALNQFPGYGQMHAEVLDYTVATFEAPAGQKIVAIPSGVLAALLSMATPRLEELCDFLGKQGHAASETYFEEIDAVDIARKTLISAGLALPESQ